MRPCPTRIRSRAVMVRTGSGPVDYIADRVQVIDVSLSSSGDEVDRSEVLDPLAPPRASVVLGRRMASVTIQQEVYGDLSQHAALFRACPVEVTQSSAGIAGVVSSSPSARGQRCTIEIVEVGGNRYRVEDALGVFTMSGAPGERLLLQFDLQGELVPVEDAGFAPMTLIMPPAPLVYRNASLLASEQTFATCPEFSFDPGMTLETTDLVCSPDGGRAAYVQRDAQAVLALTGVLSVRESIDRHWAAARAPVCGSTLDATVWSDDASSVRVELHECATVDPALAEVEGFAAYDLAVGAGAWSLVWDIDEGVPLPVQLGAVIWLDPSDVATLFVDSAGTTPVQFSGDPVGLWKNKGTLGAVGDAAQPVSASRPVWTGAGGGRIAFDGVSSAINISHRFEQWGFTVASTIAVVSGGYFIGNGANAEGYWAISRQSSWDVGNRTAIVGVLTSTGWQIQSNVDDSTQNDPISSIGVFSVNDSSIRTRGGKTVSSNPITAPEPLAARDLIRIGAIRATSLHANMDAGHIFLFDRELNDEEQMKLLAWMEAQHGI